MRYSHFRDLLGPSPSILREILVVFWKFAIFEVSEWSSWSLGVPGGSFWGLGRSGEVSGEVWGSQGGSGGVPGRLPKIIIFFFFGGEFAHGLMKYGHVRNGVILWSGRWSWCHATFLSFFEACKVPKQWGEYALKTNCFLTIPRLSSSDFVSFWWNYEAKNMI